jgi:hypothetical protein
MRDAFKAAISLSWATSLFTASQIGRLLRRDGREDAERAFNTVSGAAAFELGASRRTNPSSAQRTAADEIPERRGRLHTDRIVVLGEGLAAGVGDFALSEESQRFSFPAQAARQMRATFVIPGFQSPGIYGAPGLPPQPVILPHLMQTTVVEEFPPRRPYNNLAIPDYELCDSLMRRPTPPLVHRDDPRQTCANFVLGLPALTIDPGRERPTQLEYAVHLKPTLAIVELGYAEVLRLALSGAAARVTDLDEWVAAYQRLVGALRGAGSDVLVATVPDPFDTSGCLTVDAAARALRVSSADLRQRYQLAAEDCLTIDGLTHAAFQLLGGRGSDLGAHGVVGIAARHDVSDRVERMNAAIAETVGAHGVHLLDLHRVFRQVREQGARAGNRVLTAEFLGGFYTLNGVYPGPTGHAVIANELLARLNQLFGAQFPLIDVSAVCDDDPVADYRPPRGDRRPVPPPAVPPPPDSRTTVAPRRREAPAASPRLRLPASLEMTVSLSHAGSYHGDAIRVVDCHQDADSRFGSCAGVLFGGPVLFDSHLAGALRIRFTPPRNDSTEFTITFDPLVGDDGVLSAPMFFRWPVQGCRVLCEPGPVSTGTLNLVTGEVTNLSLTVRYVNSALQALVSVNPSFPDQPIVFPGQYGSAWAKFQQRDDDALDFTFYGSTFLPLGSRLGEDDVRWALPLAGAPLTCASIRARGLALHPHLQLSTLDPLDGVDPRDGERDIDLPHNTVCELTLWTGQSRFGDQFTLNSPELGGPAVGRSHLLGRLLVQTGEPCGESIPVAVWLMAPGGLLGQEPPAALAALFPGRLSPGPVGHDEHLRFPMRNYFVDGATLIDDPFDVSVGAVDLRSGRFINQLLHRGFIGQDLFFSLLRIEPRTPRRSFLFRGPAAFDVDRSGDLTFTLRASVRVPYPAGFAFPAPDLTSAIIVGADSALDPYLWVHATTDRRHGEPASLSRTHLRSTTGEAFSYHLEWRNDDDRPLMFEYTNHAQQGTFRGDTVSWLGHSRVASASGETDIYTFAGFGRWSKDPTERAHQVSAQIATGAEEYVSIQIDSGLVSNVNTRPAEQEAVLT